MSLPPADIRKLALAVLLPSPTQAPKLIGSWAASITWKCSQLVCLSGWVSICLFPQSLAFLFSFFVTPVYFSQLATTHLVSPSSSHCYKLACLFFSLLLTKAPLVFFAHAFCCSFCCCLGALFCLWCLSITCYSSYHLFHIHELKNEDEIRNHGVNSRD